MCLIAPAQCQQFVMQCWWAAHCSTTAVVQATLTASLNSRRIMHAPPYKSSSWQHFPSHTCVDKLLSSVPQRELPADPLLARTAALPWITANVVASVIVLAQVHVLGAGKQGPPQRHNTHNTQLHTRQMSMKAAIPLPFHARSRGSISQVIEQGCFRVQGPDSTRSALLCWHCPVQ